MATTYRKTAKGVDEVQTRANRLSPRARSALILVDGARTDEDIARLVSVQPQETLQALLAGGFIEAVATSAPAPLPRADAAVEQRAPVDFKRVQREAVRRLLDLVGPSGDDLAMRMEAARQLDQLRPLLINARSLITHVRGPQVAAEYISALSAL